MQLTPQEIASVRRNLNSARAHIEDCQPLAQKSGDQHLISALRGILDSLNALSQRLQP